MYSAIAVTVVALATVVVGQSNYANHGNSIEYTPGLPDQATLDGRVTKLDDLSPVIFLNRTKAALNCAAGTMEAELKFEEPFYGIAYADFNRNSPCFVAGNGNISYKIEMPLKGCGTKQDPQRVFTNNIIVRFHPGLEMDGDEVITIVCRYPPPIAPVPAGILDYIRNEAPPAAIVEPPLKGFQIMLVVCAIFFLSLVLLGLGASYYCLSRRRLAVVRRRPATASLAGSEITKLSGSTLGSISLFEGLKIPRAVVTPAAGSSSLSGSEAALIIDDHSDTLPSDYPSESPSSAHSEVEVATMRQAPSEVSSIYDNSAYAEESMFAHNQIITPPPPQFDVSVRVKRVAPTPPPRASSSTAPSSPCSTPPPPMPIMPMVKANAETRMEAMKIQERNLTTILEREDRMVTPSPVPMASAITVQPEIHPTVTITTRPPVYSRILRRQKSDDSDVKLTRRDSLTTLNTEMTDTHSVSEIMEDTPQKIQLEPPVIALRKPEITQHVVDDVFLRTITEKRIIEDIERRKREVTEFHARIPPPPPPPVNFDVAIRTYPDPNTPQDWDRYSTASSSTMISEIQPNDRYRAETNIEPTSTQHNYLTTKTIPIPETSVRNWDVLIRILQPDETFTATYNIEPDMQSPQLVQQAAMQAQQHHHQQQHMDDDRASICSSMASVLTEADREKWRQIITTESTLRTLLTEATVREDYERIRNDQRYEQLFEPQKWDVIIRVLAPPEEEEHSRLYEQRQGATKYRKNTTSRDNNWDNRSRRSSLPTLYEFDSDAASTTNTDRPPKVEPRSRKTSRSSYRSDMDVRSMSEFTVNDQYRPDDFAYSDASGPSYGGHYTDEEDNPGSLIRSASQPSLARSASEFTERRWAVESNTAGDLMASSPDNTPVLARRARSSELLLLASTTTSSYTASSSHNYRENWGEDTTSFK